MSILPAGMWGNISFGDRELPLDNCMPFIYTVHIVYIHYIRKAHRTPKRLTHAQGRQPPRLEGIKYGHHSQ